MKAAIDKEERGLYYLINITGDFSVQSLLRVREAVEEAMTVGHINIAFNMEKVTLIDSSGIGLIVNLTQKLVAKGGNVYLVAVPQHIREMMEPSGVLSVTQVLQTLEEADSHIG